MQYIVKNCKPNGKTILHDGGDNAGCAAAVAFAIDIRGGNSLITITNAANVAAYYASEYAEMIKNEMFIKKVMNAISLSKVRDYQ